MGGRCIFLSHILLVIFLRNIVEGVEERNHDIIITDNRSSNKIGLRNPSNATAILSDAPTIVQQGSNVYIKPKFIIGSPFTSYKQGKSPDDCQNNYGTPKVPDKEPSMVVVSPGMTQNSAVIMPPIMLPPLSEGEIYIPPSRLPVEPLPSVPIPSPCLPFRLPITTVVNVFPIPCPTFTLPSEPPQPLRYKVVIPKPPELPPIVLPKLPVQVLIEKPIILKPSIPFPEQPLIFPVECPPMVKCVLPKEETPSITEIFSIVINNFRNFFNIPSRINLSSLFAHQEDILMPDISLAFPTFCAQGIIAQRVIPNIVKNKNIVKVLMNPIFPSQLTGSGFNRK